MTTDRCSDAPRDAADATDGALSAGPDRVGGSSHASYDPTAPIELRSDNCAGVATHILAAIEAANAGTALAYGEDDWTEQMHARVAEAFEHDVAVFPVVSGTAANSLALSALCPPWGAVLCHETAHINVNEAAATSMFSGGAAIIGLGGGDAKLDVASVEQCFARTGWGDPHRSQPAVLSLTQPTDFGTVYTVDEVTALSAVAAGRGLRVHLDGARLANAVVGLGCTPAELTWRAGVEVLTLGATKNGALSTDAIVAFDASLATELRHRLKRAGHVASKMRFQSVQIDAYLADGRWLDTARTANATMERLVAGLAELGVTPLQAPGANMVFTEVDPATADRWAAAGLRFYRMASDLVRFVTSFETTNDDVDEALRRMAISR